MKFEPQDALDSQAYSLVRGLPSSGSYLPGADKEQSSYIASLKDASTKGDVQAPVNISYPQLTQDAIAYRRDGLSAVAEIIDSNENADVQALYGYWIGIQNQELDAKQAALDGDMEALRKANEQHQVVPSAEVVQFACSAVVEQIYDDIDVTDSITSQAAMRALHLLPGISEPNSRFRTPDIGLLHDMRTEVLAWFAPLLAKAPDTEKLNATEVKAVFEAVFDDLKPYYGRHFILEANGVSKRMTIKDSGDIVLHPDRTMSRGKLEELIYEETAHMLHAENGWRSRLQLLGSGLGKYEHIVEAFGDLVSYLGTNEVLTQRRLSINTLVPVIFALGMDTNSGVPRNFKDTFEMLETYYLYRKLAKQDTKNEKKALTDARTMAFDETRRVFLGSDYQTPGVINYSHSRYAVGRIVLDDYLARVLPHNVNGWKYLLQGKFDPTNNVHATHLKNLGFSVYGAALQA
jgi:hypothetical protein